MNSIERGNMGDPEQEFNDMLVRNAADIADEPQRRLEEIRRAKEEETHVDAAIHEQVQAERLATGLEKLLAEGAVTSETTVAHLLFLLQRSRDRFSKEQDGEEGSERILG
jgi:hypothetical protein